MIWSNIRGADHPRDLQSFYLSVRACAAVFDDAILPENPKKAPEQIALEHSNTSELESKLPLWFLKASALVQAVETARSLSAEALYEEYEYVNWNPPFPRWQTALEKILDQIKAHVEVVPLITEWKCDVDCGFRSRYSSRIANQREGQKLTESWINYRLYSNYQSAINIAMPLISQTASPVSDLAAILLIIYCLRKALFESQPEIPLQSSNKKLGTVLFELKALVDLGALPRIMNHPNFESLPKFLPSFPLRPEDAAMIGTVIGTQVNNDVAGQGRFSPGNANPGTIFLYRSE